MKKAFAIISSLIMVVGLLSACGSNDSGASADSSTGAGTNKKVTLTYVASQGWVSNAEMELGKKFEEETGIKIDYQIIPSDQYANVIKTKLNANEGPDLFGGQSGLSEITANYNVVKNAIDLSDQEWVKREDPLSVKQASVDGKVYGLTIWDTSGSFVINYNKKIFNDLAIAVPKTYEEFKAASLKIQQAGITPLFEPVADGWHQVMWFSEPGPQYEKLQPNLYSDLNANKTTFAESKVMKTALSQLKELYDLNLFGDNVLSDVGPETASKMASGQYAMALANQGTVSDIVQLDPNQKAEDYGYFVLPIADNQIYYMNPGGPTKFIYSGGKHIEEAKQYLAFLTKPENLQYLLDNDNTLFALNFTDVKDKWNDEQKKLHAAYPEQGIDMQNDISYFNPQWMDIGKDIVAMFSGAMTEDDVLKNIDKRRADMAKVAQDPAWK